MSRPSTAPKGTIPAVTILHTTTSRLLKSREHTPASSNHNVFSACSESLGKVHLVDVALLQSLHRMSLQWMSRHCNRFTECRFSGCRAIAIASTNVASMDVAPLQSFQRMSLQWMSHHCNCFNECRTIAIASTSVTSMNVAPLQSCQRMPLKWMSLQWMSLGRKDTGVV